MPEREVATLLGHTYAVRRVLFSPHVETMVASCRWAGWLIAFVHCKYAVVRHMLCLPHEGTLVVLDSRHGAGGNHACQLPRPLLSSPSSSPAMT